MLGGINNELFFQGFGGFFAIIIFIFFLRWISPAKKDPIAAARRREVKRSLRALKRK